MPPPIIYNAHTQGNNSVLRRPDSPDILFSFGFFVIVINRKKADTTCPMKNNIALYNIDLFFWQNMIASKPKVILYVTEGCVGVKESNGFDQIARFLNQNEAVFTLATAGYAISKLENGQVIAKKPNNPIKVS